MRASAAELHETESGFTLIELMITLFLSSLIMVSVMSAMMQSTSYFHDRRIRGSADERAHALLDMIAFDIRMAGAGMPIGQKDFAIGDASLGTATYPILLNAAADFITVRLNQRGIQTVLTSDYTPSSTSRTFSVLSSDDLAIGDTVYLSNMTAGGIDNKGGIDGLRGVVQAISGNTITIEDSFVASVGATFKSGSTLHRVDEISYDSTSDITRNDGDGPITLLPRSRFTLTYFDDAGGTIALPLTATVLRNDLMRIRIRVTVDGAQPLKNGENYTAVAEQDVMIRNLFLSRP